MDNSFTKELIFFSKVNPTYCRLCIYCRREQFMSVFAVNIVALMLTLSPATIRANIDPLSQAKRATIYAINVDANCRWR